MKPILISYDGHNINDTTNYVGRLPYGLPMQASSAKATFIQRAGANPVYSGKEISEAYITLSITLKGTLRDQLETINQWFNKYDETPRQLIVKDTDDSDKQYSIYATTVSISPVTGRNVKITLARKDPIWKSVTQNSTSWTITIGDGSDTQAVVNNGNIETYPLLEFTPTSYPTGGWGYSRKVQFYPTSAYAWANRPVEIFGGIDTAALVSNAAISNQINNVAGITAAATTIAIDTAVGGGLPSAGMGYVGTEQITWTANSGTSLTGVTRGVGGTTAATHADNAVITKSVIQADGRDVRVLVSGVEVNRWFGDSGTSQINQSATKCWIVLDVPAKSEMILKTAIANSGLPATIDFTYTTANKTALTAMPASGRVLIDSEEFSYTAKTITTTTLSVTVYARNIRNTSIAAHSVGATVRYMPFDITFMYGNSAADAADIDDTEKPVIDLANSTNASFVYATFQDTADPKGQRAGSWRSAIISTAAKALSQSEIYYGVEAGVSTNPANVMGMKIAAYEAAALFKADTCTMEWRADFPDGISSVDSNGEKYRKSTKWATTCRLYSSILGTTTWVAEWAATEATPASANTWTAWSHAGEAIAGSARYLKFGLVGTSLAVDGDSHAFEVTAMTIALVNYPAVSVRAEESSYYLEAKITNSTTGEYITFQYPMLINETLYIDTDPNQPYAKKHGLLVNIVKPDTNRSNWLHLNAGSNTLTYAATSANNITCVVKTYDRLNFL